ncbi:MAG: SUMF1/EgtB/PvdO family nonheme iron enzyme [Deltaproteobacteria bacterium]|nr:SUMF1/EgtB/PvdO family nonheme iron enzyme [Deltaproteobacteria bacterium]
MRRWCVSLADFTQCTTSDGRYASCVDARCDLDYEEMFVPAGPFVMGIDEDESSSGCLPAISARGERIVTLSGYFIDRYEVTNRRFKRCHRVGRCPPGWYDGSVTRPAYLTDPAYDDYPALYFRMTEAQEYCAYEGKRLPSEAEWEKAARGGCEVVPPETCDEQDERVVPWDWPPLDDYPYTCAEANHARYIGESCPNDTDRVGARPAGRSPYGVDDMIGNVDEWTSDCAASYADCPGGCVDPRMPCDPTAPPVYWDVVVRGGSFTCSGHLTHREVYATDGGDETTGFRCVRPMFIESDAASAKGGDGSTTGSRRREGEDDGQRIENRFAFVSRRLVPGMPLAGGERPASTASLSSRPG